MGCASWAHLHLQVSDPPDACANISVPVLDSKPWIALIKRSERARTDCSFDIKVSCPSHSLKPRAACCHVSQVKKGNHRVA